MTNEKNNTALIQLPTEPRANEADVAALKEWQKTGTVPMQYVQDQLRRGFSSGQDVADLVMASLAPITDGTADVSHHSENPEIDILKRLAEKHGFTLHKKPKSGLKK